MSEALRDRAAELARLFDDSFTRPVVTADRDAAFEDLLGLRVANQDYAALLSGVFGLLPAQRIVPLPGPLPELLGIVGLRGKVVPTYSLAALLGHAPAAEPPTWVLLIAADPPLGLAFDAFSGYLRVPRADLVAGAPGGGARLHVDRAVRIQGALRGIIELPSLARIITERSAAAGKGI